MATEDHLNEIISDLQIFLENEDHDQLDQDAYEELLDNLQSDDVQRYFRSFQVHSELESTLRENFFSPTSNLAQYIFRDVFPESRGEREEGSVDYIAQMKNKEIKIEIKPLYTASYSESNSGIMLTSLTKKKLNPEKHKTQILKYLRRTGEFVVLTNLEDWYFFSKSFSLKEACPHFAHKRFSQVLIEFKLEKDFWHYLDRLDDLSKTEDLDKNFFQSLKQWVDILKEIDFKTEYEDLKLEKIVFLINKFIFIQTLDKLWAIPIGFLKREWDRSILRWDSRSHKPALEEFFNSGLNKFFWKYYDTELFREKEENISILNFIEDNDENIDNFYKSLKKILGIDFSLTRRGMVYGILQFNFRRIDEDILGKAYESFLAEVREEHGIYYTPYYITKYISKSLIRDKFNVLLESFKNELESENFDACKEILSKIASIKIVDPACGSGSFLIKILKSFWKIYKNIFEIVEKAYEISRDGSSLTLTTKSAKINDLLNLVNLKNPHTARTILNQILLQNIYGVDLDNKALQVSKLNLWLNAIKLNPRVFQYWKLKKDKLILPKLELNLREGNSLVSPPIDYVSNLIKNKNKDKIILLHELRAEYIKNISKPELIKNISDIIEALYEELKNEFLTYLIDNNLPQEILTETKPFYWCLDFWHAFFNTEGEIFGLEHQGFDIIISNPPYVAWNEIIDYRNFFELKRYDNWTYDCRPNHDDAQPNLYIFFIIRGMSLLKEGGSLSYILPREWLFHDKTLIFRNQLIDSTQDLYIFKFHPEFKVFRSTSPDGTSSIVGTTSLILKFNKGNNDNMFDFELEETEKNKVKEFLKKYSLNEIYSQTISEYALNSELLVKSEFKNKRWETYSKLIQNLIDQFEDDDYIDLNSRTEFSIFAGFQPNVTYSYNFLVDGEQVENFSDQEKAICFRCIYDASDIERYYLKESNNWWVITNDLFDTEEDFRRDCPKLYQILYDNIQEKSDKWWEFMNVRNLDKFREAEIKILSPRTANRNSFCIDTKRHIIKGTNSVIISQNLNHHYCLGILNSKLADYWYQEYGFNYHGGETKKFEPKKVKQYMIKIFKAPENDQDIIVNLVENLTSYKKVFKEIQKIWKNYIEDDEIESKALGSIILNDKDAIGEGRTQETWTKSVNLYPNANNPLLHESFEYFKIDNAKPDVLRIYGIQNQSQILVLELQFRSIELKTIIFLEMLKWFDSKLQIKRLIDIYEKIKISVIKPNTWENSKALFNQFTHKFKLWLNNENITLTSVDVLEIYNQIQELDYELDARIFKIYGLGQSDIDSILKPLNISDYQRQQILRCFNSL